MSGQLNQAGSTVIRSDEEGAQAIYAYDGGKACYVSTDGAGAYDTFVAAGDTLQWMDGATGFKEIYDRNSGRMTGTLDIHGNVASYAYAMTGPQAGLLTSVTDASGQTTCFDYTDQRQLTQIRVMTPEAGNTGTGASTATITTTRTRFAHDAQGRLSSVSVDLSAADNSIADGQVYVTAYTYEATSSRLASVVQSDGTKLAFTYLWDGTDFRVASVTDGIGQLTRFAYDAVNRKTTVTDALGLQTVYGYDGKGQLTQITAPAMDGISVSTRYVYTANGDLSRIIDGAGRALDLQYDDSGNQIQQRDAAGNTVTRTWDAGNRLLTETIYAGADPDGSAALLPTSPLTTRHVYDAAGRGLLRFVLSAEGRVTEYRYNAYGERSATIQYAESRFDLATLGATAVPTESQMQSWRADTAQTGVQRSDRRYDYRGQLQMLTTYSAVDAHGNGIADGSESVRRYVYDQAGQLRMSIDASNGGMTSYVYDGLGRLLSTTDAQLGVTLNRYDDAHHRISTTFTNGLTTSSLYDARGALVSTVRTGMDGAELGKTRYAYDANGRLRMTTEPSGRRSFLLHDAAGRKLAAINPAGELIEYRYNETNQIVRIIGYATRVDLATLVDANGVPTDIVLAALRPAGTDNDSVTWQSHDGAGRMVKSVNGNGHVTQNTVDGAGRLVRVTRYAAAINTAAFGTAGNEIPASSINPVAHADDRTTRSFYDADGNLVGQLDAEGSLVESRYNAAGQLVETVAYANMTALAQRDVAQISALRPVAAPADIHQYRLYNGKGELAGTIDGEGYLTEYAYDLNGNLAHKTRYATAVTYRAVANVAELRPPAAAEDQVIAYAYTILDQLKSETAADGTLTHHDYDAAGNVVATTRALNTLEARTTRKRYDLQGRVIAELSAEGADKLTGLVTQSAIDAVWTAYAVKYTLDADGRRIRVTDQRGYSTLYFHDSAGRLAFTVDATGAVEGRAYNALAQLQAVTYFSNRLAEADLAALTGGTISSSVQQVFTQLAGANDSRKIFSYDRTGMLTAEQTLSAGQTVLAELRTTFDAFGEVSTQSERINATQMLTRQFSYDHRGMQTRSQADPSGVNVTVISRYDAFGRMIETAGANDLRTMQYDRNGRTVTLRDGSLNATSMTTYDAFDRILSHTDGIGNATHYRYETQQRRMTITTAEGMLQVTQTNRFGQQARLVDANGNVTTYTYDANGNLKAVNDALGRLSATEYDRTGNAVTIIDAAGTRTSLSYDAANRVLSKTVDAGGLNLTTRYAYDARGRMLSVTDANGTLTQTSYDAKGQASAITVDPAGLNLVTRFNYDQRGKTLQVTDPAGTVTAYDYDALGRRMRQSIDPAGLNLSTNFEYDELGNVIARQDPNGYVTRFVVDAGQRVTWQVDANGAVAGFVYDANGRSVRTTHYATAIDLNGFGPRIAAADILARLTLDAAHDQVQENVYDKDGRLAFTIDGKGAIIEQQFDGNGNVVRRISYAHTAASSMHPAASMAAAKAAASAIANPAHDQVTVHVFDARNRMLGQVDGRGAVTAWRYDANGSVIEKTAYATMTGAALLASDHGLTMAALDACIKTAGFADAAHDVQQRFAYDRANRLVASATAQASDAAGVVHWAVVSQTLDKNGQLLARTAYANLLASDALPANATQSDVANWIASVIPDSARDNTMRHVYDAAGRAVFMIDPASVITQYVLDANGNVVRRIVYTNPHTGTGIAALTSMQLIWESNPAFSVWRTVFDRAGRAVAEIDPEGALTRRYYDANGNAIATVQHAISIDAAALPSEATLEHVRALSFSNPDDRIERRLFDAANQLQFSVNAEGAVTQFVRDGLGRVVGTAQFAHAVNLSDMAVTAIDVMRQVILDPSRDRSQTFSYDVQGNLTQSVDALGAVERWRHDALGRKTGFTNKLGASWDYDFDAAGRMVLERAPMITVVRTAIDLNGMLSAGTADVRVETHLDYDAFGNLVARTEAAGQPEERITRFEYDAAGRQVRTIFPPVAVYDAARDDVFANGALGDAVRIETEARSLAVTVIYDAFGNAVSNTDVGGIVSYKTYDNAHRLAFEIDAAGYVTAYMRDGVGRVTALTRHGAKIDVTQFANGPKTSAAVQTLLAPLDHALDRTLLTRYDRLDRAIKITEPLAFAAREATDADGNVDVSYFMQRKVTEQRFNAFGELIESAVHGEDAQGNASAMGQGAHKYFEYDRRGMKVAQFDFSDAAHGYLTTFAADAAGNTTDVTEYASQIPVPLLARDGWHSATPVTSNADRTRLSTYDRGNRKISETLTGNATGSVSTLYGYDALGNLTSTTDALNNVSFTRYDAMNRVIATAAPSAALLEKVVQLYVTLTGMAPDAVTARQATCSLARGEPLAHLAQALMLTNGMATCSNVDFINTLYSNADARAPDAEGGSYWTSLLEQGLGRGDLVNSFISSIVATIAASSVPAAQHTFSMKVAAAMPTSQAGDVLTPVTQFQRDVYGNVTRRIDHGQSGSASALGIAAVASAQDRLSTTVYDRSGHAIQTIDANGHSVFNSFDAQGHVVKQWQTVSDMDGARHTAFSVSRYDALGQLTETIEPLAFAAMPKLHAEMTVTDSDVGTDYATRYNNVALSWDALTPPGTELKVLLDWRMSAPDNAAGIAQSSSFTTFAQNGDVFSWRVESGDAGAMQAIDRIRVYALVNGQHVLQYDRSGVQAMLTGVTASIENGALASVTHRATTFNAFGEAISTSVDGQQTSYADYDAAGHLWRTNGGDGVNRVLLTDIDGRVTATMSSTVLDLHHAGLQNAAQAYALPGLIRAGVRYDFQGHVIEQTMAAPDTAPVVATAVKNTYVRVSTVARMPATVGNDGPSPWKGFSRLQSSQQMRWSDLSSLGSGDIRVAIESASGGIATERSQTFDASVAAMGVTLDWDDAQMLRIVISKKDVNGEFQTVLSRDFSHVQAIVNTSLIEVATPAEISTRVYVRYRLVGSAAWLSVPEAHFLDFGSARVFDASTLADGRYEYEILEQPAGGITVLRESGRWTSGVTELRIQATRLFVLLFNRAPDSSSLISFVNQLQGGKSLGEVAQSMFDAPMARPYFPDALSNADIIERVFAGALGTAPDAAMLAQWRARLDAVPVAQRGEVFAELMFAVSMYDGRDAAALTARDLFVNKVSVAFMYAAELGGADANVASAIIDHVTATDTSAAVRAARDSVSVISGACHRQITQLIVLLFNRAPTAMELQAWVAQLQAGQTLASVAQAVYDAGKATAFAADASAAAVVASMYRGALGREPDQGGLDYWSTQIDSGQPNAVGTVALAMIDAVVAYDGSEIDVKASQRLFRNKVAVGMTYADGLGAIDAEAAKGALDKVSSTDTSVALGSLFNASNPRQRAQVNVTQLYVLLLDRAPDIDGLNFWREQREAGASIATIAGQMIAAVPSIFDGLTDDAFVRLLYANGTGRAADEGGLAYWKAQLRSNTRGAVASGFAAALATVPVPCTATLNSASFEIFTVKTAAGLTYAMQGGQAFDSGAHDIVVAAIADRNADLMALAAQAAQLAANIASANAAAAAAQAANAAVASAAAELESAAAAAALANVEMQAAGDAALAAQQAAIAAHAIAAAKLSAAQTADRLAAEAQQTAIEANAGAKAAVDVAAKADNAESSLIARQAQAAANAAALACNDAVIAARAAQSAYGDAVRAANDAQTRANTALAAYNAARTSYDTAVVNLQAAQAKYQISQSAAIIPNRIMAATTLQRTQVMQLYVLLFNRSYPDLAGVDYWITQLKNGQGFSAIAQNMYSSGGLTGRSNQAVIESIYAGAFGRTVVDAGGIAYWTTMLDNAAPGGKGAVFIDMLNAVAAYAGTDPLGLSTKANLSNKINAGLASLQSQQTAAANVASTALAAQQSAQINFDAANASQSSAYSILQNANSSLLISQANSNTATQQYNAALSEVSTDLRIMNSTAAAADSADSDATIAQAAATAAATAANAVAALSASQAAQWRTQVVQLHALLNNNGAPTLAQANHYVAQLATGTTLAQLAQEIYAASPLATLTNANAIEMIYRAALGRTVSDTSGQNYWVEQLAQAGQAGYAPNKGQVFLSLISAVLNYAGSDLQGYLSRTTFTAAIASALDALSIQAGTAAVTAQARADAADIQSAQADATATLADLTAVAKVASVDWTAVSLAASPAQLAVTRLYALLLNRPPEASGLQYWVNQINAGASVAQIADDMTRIAVSVISPATASSTLVHNIYVNSLGRTDSAGEAYWASQFNHAGRTGYPATKGDVAIAMLDSVVNYAGNDAAALVSQILFSNKVTAGLTYAATLNGNDAAVIATLFDYVTADSAAGAIAVAIAAVPSVNNRTIVAQLHVALRGSNPDLQSFMEAANALDGVQAPATLTQDLIPPAMAAMTNSEFITQLYQNALNRNPDPDGLAYWNTCLATQGRGAVALSFVYGIPRYQGLSSSAVADQKTFTGKVAGILASVKLLSAASGNSLDRERSAALALAGTAAQQAMSAAATAAKADAAARAAFDAIREVRAYTGPAISSERRQHLEVGAQLMHTQAMSSTVRQTTDRWGNVMSSTDVRNAAWVTTYAYDAGNRQISIDAPDVDGNAGITRKGYDALGRQISATDANGNVRSQRYDAQGNLTEERHAFGVIQHGFNVFGNRTQTINTLGKLTRFDYDSLGRQTMSRGPQVAVYASIQSTWASPFELDAVLPGPVEVTGGELQQVTQRYVYDELGRRIAQSDGLDAVTRTVYDLHGNVIANIDATNRGTIQRYDAQNRLVSQADSNGKTMAWSYDGVTGRLTSHTDLGGHVTTYEYNLQGQLVRQSSNFGQDLRYAYDSAGRLKSVTDDNTKTLATYAYDAAGRRVRETTTHNGQVLQDNHLAYDAHGRLRLVADNRYRAQYDYDAAGNRTHVQTSYLDNAGNRQLHDVWHTYDELNRQRIVNGININNVIVRDTASKDSHELSYDSEGNRITDIFFGQNYRQVGSQRQIIDGTVTELYSYDAANRLTGTQHGITAEDRMSTDLRRYDAAGHVVQSGWTRSLPKQWAADLARMGLPTAYRTTYHDAAGRQLQQSVTEVAGQGTDTFFEYDRAGNLDSYREVGAGRYYRYGYDASAQFDRYQASQIVATGNGSTAITTQAYDANGHLTGATESRNGVDVTASRRVLENDIDGHVLRKSQNGARLHALVVNGIEIGTSGTGVADDSFNDYIALDAGYGSNPGAYIVRQGDKLSDIARAVWGDATLWYLLADANALSAGSALTAGQTITIPPRSTTVHGNADSFKPYDATRMTGDLTPALPAPGQSGGGCGAMGQVLMVAVAVAVTIYTVGIGTPGLSATATVAETFTAGSGAMAAGTASAGTMAMATVAGNVASQVVGMALGQQASFDWKQVGMAAVSGGVSGSLGATEFFNNPIGNAVARSAIGNVMTQGVSVVTGLQPHFEWRGVAAAAVGGGVGSWVSAELGDSFGHEFSGKVLRGTVSGFAAGVVTAGMRGGRVAVADVARDAFGNALGNSFTEDFGRAQDRQQTVGLGTQHNPYIDANGDQIIFGAPVASNMSAAESDQFAILQGSKIGIRYVGAGAYDGMQFADASKAILGGKELIITDGGTVSRVHYTRLQNVNDGQSVNLAEAKWQSTLSQSEDYGEYENTRLLARYPKPSNTSISKLACLSESAPGWQGFIQGVRGDTSVMEVETTAKTIGSYVGTVGQILNQMFNPKEIAHSMWEAIDSGNPMEIGMASLGFFPMGTVGKAPVIAERVLLQAERGATNRASSLFDLKKMDPQFLGEETGAVWGSKVKYLDDAERLKYKLNIKDGKLHNATGAPFDTSNARSAFGGNNAIFVMDEYGSIYASTIHTPGKFHHSSFLSGKPVAAAGELVVENGALMNVTRRSGHYQPTANQLEQFLGKLRESGVKLDNVKIGTGF